MRRLSAFFCVLSFAVVSQAQTVQFAGSVEAIGRYYPSKGLLAEQKQSFAELAFKPALDWRSDDKQHKLAFELYGHASAPKGARNYADIREAYYLFSGQGWQLQAGISRVFWGVTESVHLVDTINQTDILASPAVKEKLGQPMIALGVEQAWGNLDIYVLPYFRKREFNDEAERFRVNLGGLDDLQAIKQGLIDLGAPANVALNPRFQINKAFYQSRHKTAHVDVALRWRQYFSDVELALSAFHGTSRESLPVLNDVDYGPDWANLAYVNPIFSAWYEQTTKLGVELQYMVDAWALKWESASYFQDSGDYSAVATGFEYTFSNVFNSDVDIGLLSEYLWHNRKDISIEKQSLQVFNPDLLPLAQNLLQNRLVPKIASSYLSPYNNDLFLGMRFALNNLSMSYFLTGVIVDLDDQTTAFSFEGSTRIAENLRLNLNMYLFAKVNNNNLFYAFRKDDLLELKLQWFF